jgi:hypothetical protein
MRARELDCERASIRERRLVRVGDWVRGSALEALDTRGSLRHGAQEPEAGRGGTVHADAGAEASAIASANRGDVGASKKQVRSATAGGEAGACVA